MSIVSEIERIKTNIANAYTACEEKGATMPSVLNSANLMSCIESITGGGTTKILNYYGTATNLSLARRYIAATSIGDYALFGGGVNASSNTSTGSNIVDTYDKDLVKGTATNLKTGVRLLKATSNKNYAIFAGGSTEGSSSTVVSDVNAYDKNLVKATATNLTVARHFWSESATSIGEYALFGGGLDVSAGGCGNIDAYNGNLVLTSLMFPIQNNILNGATSLGDYALLSASGETDVYTYDKNLVVGTATSLSSAKTASFPISNKNFAIFAGGNENSVPTKTVEAYDVNLVKTTASELSVARFRGGQASLGEYAIIGGGATSNTAENSDSNVVEAYNSNLVKVVLHDLSSSKRLLAGTSVGKYALFGGGQSGGSSGAKNTVDVYELVG